MRQFRDKYGNTLLNSRTDSRGPYEPLLRSNSDVVTPHHENLEDEEEHKHRHHAHERRKENSQESFQIEDDTDLGNRVVFGKFVSRNHLIVNMVLNIIIFGLLFISFKQFWYCESPSTVYKLPTEPSTTPEEPLTNHWVNNQTCYTLLGIRTHLMNHTEHISYNVKMN